MSNLSGTNLVGMSSTRQRVEDDFYATPFEATRAILNKVKLYGSILEPAAGQGHISTILREYYPENEIVSTDLIQREDRFGCHIQSGIDFITHDFGRTFTTVITNPPFSLAKEFVEKGLEVASDKVLMFAKIQFLEGVQRRNLFEKNPPHAVYVFSKRVNPLRNGIEVDENGKPWSSTMCFAWFEWDKKFAGAPTIHWI